MTMPVTLSENFLITNEATLPVLADGQVWCCSNGCGECKLKSALFEYSRSEDLQGNLIESKNDVIQVSSCCGRDLLLWDEARQDFVEWKYVTEASTPQPELTNAQVPSPVATSNEAAMSPSVALGKPFLFVFINDIEGRETDHVVCVCDHPVTKAEWDDYLEAHEDEVDCRKAAFGNLSAAERDALPAYQEYREWKKANQPDASFRALHNMQVLEATQFWRS